MNIKCYSQRLLSPFRGVLNIIEYNSAEAVTMDGINWDIYVRNSALIADLEQSLTKHNHRRIQTSEIRYGRWSKKNGLKRGPTIDSDDFKEMAAKGETLYHFLCQHSDEIPFALQDYYELWLLDKENNPLVLLNSAVYQHDIDLEQTINWTTGIACQKSFTSEYFKKQENNTIHSAGAYLNQIVNEYSNKSAQWILRKKDGSGIGLDGINIESGLIDRLLSNSEIPSLLINTQLFNNQQQYLINDYLIWLSPWLLTLQSFADDQREQLEQQASSGALIIEKQYLLYPKIINQKIIKSARVEAVIRSNEDEDVAEKVEPVEYLELNNPTHHLNK